MKRRMSWMAAGVLAVLTGCGGSVCDRALGLNANVNSKIVQCPQIQPLGARPDKAGCEAGIRNCSPDEVNSINKYVDCVDRLAPCASGREEAFVTSLQACSTSTGIGTLSANCGAGFR